MNKLLGPFGGPNFFYAIQGFCERGGPKKFLWHMRYFENFRENLRGWTASPSDNAMSKGDPNHCLDMIIPYVNSLIIKMPPASRGASGRGLALRMLLPVRVVVAFVAHCALMRVPCHVCAHIVHAHDAQRTVLGSANVIVHVVSAANAAAGAGGFSRVVVSGAHAGMIPH